MSRSYKHTPGWTDQNRSSYSRWMKKYANRRFRRLTGDVQNGKWYRRYTNPWSICDYKCLYYSKNEVLKEIKEHASPPLHEVWWGKNNNWYPLYRYYMK